jgi:ribosomal protein S18 acetylase RimI-like enzyme
METSIAIKVTEAYESLVELFIRNGLEFSAEEETPTDLTRCWEARALPAAAGVSTDTGASADAAHTDGRLAGGCVLAMREGEYIIDGIAVEPDFRKRRVGEQLLERAIRETAARGGKRLYLVARAPDFFRGQGFVAIARADAPNFFECFSCPQYKTSCFPEVMRLDMDGRTDG